MKVKPEMPEQQAEVAGEKIIKADWTIYSLWMLTDEHNLYGCHFTEDNQPDMTTLELWFQGVKTFWLMEPTMAHYRFCLMMGATIAIMFWKWAVHISPIQYRK